MAIKLNIKGDKLTLNNFNKQIYRVIIQMIVQVKVKIKVKKNIIH